MSQISGEPSPSSSNSSKRKEPSIWDLYYPGEIAGHRDAILVASFPEIIYFWPSLVTMFLCAFLQGVVGLDAGGLGWLAVFVLFMNLLVLVQDFDQKKFLILVLTLFALFLISWIISLYGFTFLKSIVDWIFSFQPSMSTDAYVVLGSIFTFLFVWGLLTPPLSYWRLEQNEFVHYTQPIGKDMSIARIGCTVYKEIPDVFEFMLGLGAGSLLIRKDNQILATIPHVPFLSLRMKAIEHLLSETRVIVDKEV